MSRARGLVAVATVLCTAILVGACGSTAVTESSLASTNPPEPLGSAEVLRALVDALGEGDFAGTEPYVDGDQLALLTFIDGTSPDRVASMVQGRVPSEVLESFWRAFSESVADMSGQSIGRLEVGEPKPIGDEGEFVSIDTSLGASGRVSPWVIRSTGEGWKVDLLATFGGALAPNLWEWIESLPEGDARSIVVDVVAANQASFAVARQLGEGRLPDVAIEALQQLENR